MTQIVSLQKQKNVPEPAAGVPWSFVVSVRTKKSQSCDATLARKFGANDHCERAGKVEDENPAEL